jgi:hypothetical protein
MDIGYEICVKKCRIRFSALSITTRFRDGRQRNQSSVPGRGNIVFSSPWRPDQVWFPPVSTGGSFPGVKLPEREADHLRPSVAEAGNARSYSCTPPYHFMAWFLITHRHNFRLRLLPASSWFLASLISNPEDGRDIFLRNLWRLWTDCKALYPRKYNSS